MNFPSPLLKGTLLKHYRRSLADVRLENGQSVTAHVFFPGSLTGFNGPGSIVLLSDSGDRSRKNQLTWELVDAGGVWVGMNPKIAKHSLLEAITLDQVDSLKGYRLDDGTVAGGAGILLQSMKNNCLLDYNPVIDAEDGTAVHRLDAGVATSKQLKRLTEFAQSGHRAIVFCHVLRSDCVAIRHSASEGSALERLLADARRDGVEFLACRGDISPDGVGVGVPIPWVEKGQ